MNKEFWPEDLNWEDSDYSCPNCEAPEEKHSTGYARWHWCTKTACYCKDDCLSDAAKAMLNFFDRMMVPEIMVTLLNKPQEAEELYQEIPTIPTKELKP